MRLYLTAVKSYRNLYPHIYTFSNLYASFHAARRGKRNRAAVAGFEFGLERNLWQLQRELQEESYHPGPYTNFTG